jgi:hypothetical protein
MVLYVLTEYEQNTIIEIYAYHRELNSVEYKFYFKKIPQGAEKLTKNESNLHSFCELNLNELRIERLICLAMSINEAYAVD